MRGIDRAIKVALGLLNCDSGAGIPKKLTYSATSIKIGNAHRAGLIPLRPLRSSRQPLRAIFVTTQISDVFGGEPAPTQFSIVAAADVIDPFLRGELVTVSRRQVKWKKADQPNLVRLVGEDEVWEMCIRWPPPGWRLFGRFLDTDVFVGLSLHDKHVLGPDYGEVVGRVQEDWDRLLGGVAPVRSDRLEDYLRGVYRNMDDPDAR